MDRQTGGGASAPIFLSADLKTPHPADLPQKDTSSLHEIPTHFN